MHAKGVAIFRDYPVAGLDSAVDGGIVARLGSAVDGELHIEFYCTNILQDQIRKGKEENVYIAIVIAP